MVEQAGALPGEAETSLADSRAQFVGSLGRRLEALRQALLALEQAPKSAAHRDHLRRRIHAFGAAAGVLGFESVFTAFREAEAILGRTGAAGTLAPPDLARVARTIDVVPSLVLGANVAVSRAPGALPDRNTVERRGGGWPTCVLVFGAAALADALKPPGSAAEPTLELERTEDAERAEDLVRVLSPDVAVIDADHRSSRQLMETLAYDPLLDPVKLVAVGTFDRPEAAASLVALGVARVLPKPVSPDVLRRTVLEVSRERPGRNTRVEPLGDITVEALGERVAQEIRRGLVEAVRAQSRGTEVSLGEGTDVLAAVWASVARIRELVTLRSGGTVRFDSNGPEGAIPLAPWMSDERSADRPERRTGAEVSLSGRTIVVADDDPAIAWFLSGLFRGAGAEVIEALDGQSALEFARDKWPDVIVSDILMPGLDGFSLCREVKRDIALSDVPVILISWKEDLLQRVHELGAQADGYLRKEATASAVVQRVREVLLPRARVEARIDAGGEARGRLDGMTPRLILEMVCRRGHDARISLRDAAFLYEIDIRGGRIRGATRTTLDGRSERGTKVLAAALGVRAGRFSVRHDDSPCQGGLDASLREALDEPVARARAAQRALAIPVRIGRVELDEAAMEPYLGATPDPALSVVRKLVDGASPQSIIATGTPPRLLETVLGDLVLHGAIRAIHGTDGADLWAAELAAGARRATAEPRPPPVNYPTPSPAASAGARARAKETPPAASAERMPAPIAASPVAVSPVAVSPVAVSPVAVSPVAVSPVAASPVAASPVTASPVAVSPVTASPVGASTGSGARALATPSPPEPPREVADPFASIPPKSREAASPPAEEPAFVFGDSLFPAPRSAPPSEDAPSRSPLMKALAPPTSMPAEPSPFEAALRALPVEITGASRSSDALEAATDPARSPPTASAPAAEPLPGAADPARPPRPEPRGEPSEAGGMDLGDAVMSALGDDSPAPPPPKAPTPLPAKLGEQRAVTPGPMKLGEARSPTPAPLRLPTPTPAKLAEMTAATPAPLKAPEPDGPELSFEVVPEPDEEEERPSTALKPLPAPVRVGGATPEPAPSVPSGIPKTTLASARDLDPPKPADPTPEPTLHLSTEPGPVEESASSVASSAPRALRAASDPPVPSSAPPRASSSGRAAEPVRAPPSKRAARPEPTPARKPMSSGPPAPSKAPESSGSPLGIAIVVVVAATTSFALVSAIKRSAEPDVTAPSAVVVEPTAAPALSTAPAPTAEGVKAPAAAGLVVEALDLPEGIAVPAGRGMLELAVPAATSIMVDQVEIGPGPLRRLPLAQGTHQVRVVGAGFDDGQSLDVRAGRRTRVSVKSVP